eukprot:gene64902-88779_t
MLGTSMCWGTVRQQQSGSPGLISMPHVYGGHDRVYTFGGALTAGAAEVWYRQAFLTTTGTPAPDLATLEREAAALPAGADGLLFLPYLMGERSPVWDAQASACFLGLGLRHGRMHLYRAVLEGVALALQHNITAGLQGAGTPHWTARFDEATRAKWSWPADIDDVVDVAVGVDVLGADLERHLEDLAVLARRQGLA